MKRTLIPFSFVLCSAIVPIAAHSGETLERHISIRYTDGEIFNPATGRMDNVRLRSYQAKRMDSDVSFVPPTISLNPGDTLLMHLSNDLPKNDPSCVKKDDINIPHCFNATNMHTHGLWVSPSGNSDNVTLRLSPGARFTHEYNVPSDHPAGTFWYHPHTHGSTALQVSSGMGGPLIVRGNRMPAPGKPGDIDTLLKEKNGKPVPERILTFTQIAYACGPRRADGSIEIKADQDGFWICDSDDVGMVEGYNQFGLWENFDTPDGIPEIKTRWEVSGRHTTINGKVMPTFDGVQAGKIERWRLIQAGVNGSVSMSFRKYTGSTEPDVYAAGDSNARDAFVANGCTGEEVTQFSIALDGLTRDRVNVQSRTMLHPGYRDDVLVAFPEPGVYCMVDNDAPEHENIRMQKKQRQILGFVHVDGTRSDTDPVEHVQKFLTTAATKHMPSAVREQVTEEVSGDVIRLDSFVAHRSLLDAKVDSEQTLGFDVFLIEDAPQNEFVVGELEVPTTGQPRLINASDYQLGRIDRTLTLGNVEEWTLAAFTEGHPFHKHVNPIQIVSIIDPDSGADVSAFGSGSVYSGLKGQWKDTLFLPTNVVGAPFVVKVRTHYRRYIGTFVLHCHILDHEDMGMMQVLQIVLPSEGASHAKH